MVFIMTLMKQVNLYTVFGLKIVKDSVIMKDQTSLSTGKILKEICTILQVMVIEFLEFNILGLKKFKRLRNGIYLMKTVYVKDCYQLVFTNQTVNYIIEKMV